MRGDAFPTVTLAVMLAALAGYFPLSHLLPESMHAICAFLLTCSIIVFLVWAVACFVVEVLRRH